MNVERIEGANANLGAPKDWDEATMGTCETLAVRVVVEDGNPRMLSKWRPDADDLARLNAGGHLVLSVVGLHHPAVWISAEPAPR